ncbi:MULTISPECIES: EAL domain-containing protein [Pseudonocardia]|uniref:EAL domain protein n=2 Tax=Pseudonocardia TaxID=1847 RepID=A0A1Y2N4F7_PSEAH|nr:MULTISPECIES: EAL domain-containing protein [Pseudonocardia]OSY42364.1 EAL domain protein [Pseudonocardia autotrophica]TDN75884.1 EAL domain-containing protein (putative c-di-GMP-specific phosphodiesterase class I) [Pseudonocardia autotrophica]BBF99856.1 EAL domain-containing protein [Pseudonocardia autotrophica]GEC28381.1 EAL domain-containing protein [Pseudonocardia saturnea]
MTDQRFAYEPVHDLRSGRLAGVEVVPRRAYDAVAVQARDRGWGARQVAELDAGTAVSAVLSAPAAPGTALQVDVAADTVLYARERLRSMLGAVAPLLEIGPPITAAAPAEHLVPALAELRRWGFRIGLDGAGRTFGPELVAAIRPDVLKLEPDLADGVLETGSGAAVRAVLEVARAVGVPVAATGVRDPERLSGLYASGVALAQGPLLGGARATPEPDPATLPELLALLRSAPAQPVAAGPVGPPVRGLATPAVTLAADVVADTAREAMRERPESAGVVLVDGAHRPVGYLDRSRFLLAMTGRFGHALWADKPASSLADPPRTVDERAPLPLALELSLAGDPARAYDDLVVVGPDGVCRGVVTVAELWRRTIRPSGTPARPPAGSGAPRSVTGPPTPRSVSGDSAPRPVADAAVPRPVNDAAVPRPVNDAAAPRPVAGPPHRRPPAAPPSRTAV